jgi:SNF2 family DNA or RNA helicase
MNVSTAQPFQIIYSVFQHEYLGYLLESFVVQLDAKGKLTLKSQNISSKNADEFSTGLDDNDFQLIRLMDSIQQDAIIKRFYHKKIAPIDFFLKIYDKDKGDDTVKDAIDSYIETKKSQILPLLKGKMLFEMGKDANPTWKKVEILEEKATVLFHFFKNETNTHYFPTIKYKGEKVDFQYKDGLVICNEPAWLIVNNKLYSFDKNVDGHKLKPFLHKKFIEIPQKVEETYYRKFIANLIASFDVSAVGFTINSEVYKTEAILSFSELATPVKLVLFGEEAEEPEEEAKILFDLSFKYGNYTFKADQEMPSSVSMEKTDDSYIFHKIKRDVERERDITRLLLDRGIVIKNGKATLNKSAAFSWINANNEFLEEENIYIKQNSKSQRKYFIGKSSINLEVKEKTDWFDIHATVVFGPYEIPFLKIRDLIIARKREFTLPNGEIAVIPEEWFIQYAELLAFTITDAENLKLQKYHLSLVKDLEEGNLAKITMSRKLEKLREFEEIEDFDMPRHFHGELRPYQKAGYNWMQFLNSFRFGGCLADDMGLGKTIQTLAMLLSQKEQGNESASLLIMPTSLIYNWEKEAKKFTPTLKVYLHTGSFREKSVEIFHGYDVILTSYGIARIDVELLEKYVFNYIILDESQAIKNPASNIAKAVKKLNSRHRLILTGTPLENTTLDLWSQMSFVNPGLLGSQKFFKEEFLYPIEKKNDELKTQKLYSIIKPFILRRHKSQVATELPEKVENITYCTMTDEQEHEYEEAKSYFRNMILDELEHKNIAQSQIILLQGLTKLRQIANHPKMVIPEYQGNSGKMEDVVHMILNAIGNNHKILVFSQFVKHLSILRGILDSHAVKYSYLDGNTKDRQAEVNNFQERNEIKAFLITLKAGGLGLNLTSADYVFILDPWWNPAIEAQAVDRAHRIGQTNKVFTYKFITRNTVEEKILALQQNKKKLANDLITTEESFVKTLTREDIHLLLD